MMNRNLPFDFLVDKENNTITIRREFAAGRQLVWDCHTQAELLDQWFAPKPFTTRTKSMEFRNGGHWHFAMISPEGEHFWSLTQYRNIRPIDGYETLDAFSNEAGEINTEMPCGNWEVTFTDSGAHTLVQTVVTYGNLADIETVVSMGMEAGFKSTLERLDELLELKMKMALATSHKFN